LTYFYKLTTIALTRQEALTMKNRRSRREFLQEMARVSLAAPFVLSPGCGRAAEKTVSIPVASTIPERHDAPWKNRLVEIHSEGVFNGSRQIHANVLGAMVKKALEKLTGEEGEKAWQSLFSRKDVVAIKTSCLPGKHLSTHPELVDALVRGLHSAGVEERNIIIYDRTTRELEAAGFAISRERGPRCFGTDEPAMGYDREPTVVGEVASRFSRIISEVATAIINVPVMKDHDICGISGSLKNHLGSIDNPNKYHPDGGNPFIADINAAPLLIEKSRLIICDALCAIFDGGPAYNPAGTWNYGGLLAGSDPVAMDVRLLEIIEEKRKIEKLPSLKSEKRFPSYIFTAADEAHRVGCADPGRMDRVKEEL
jgi:uncharacterized protein (DUF362 family)